MILREAPLERVDSELDHNLFSLSLEFVARYCSKPRWAFNPTVVLRYRIHLEQRHYAPATINLRLAVDAGLLSPELAPGIRA